MKKVLSLLFALLSTIGMHADVLAELTFPGSNDKGVSSYTGEFTATNDFGTWNLVGFNNNNNAVAWTYVRCGSKSAATTASIATPEIEGNVTDVTFTVDKTSGVSSATLKVLNGSTVVSSKDITSIWAAGDVVASVTAESGSSFQLVLVNEKVSSNGTTQISKITVNGTTSGGSSDPVSVEGVVITDKEGNELNYDQFNAYQMVVGESFDIKAKVLPTNATDKSVSWEVMQHETTPAVSFTNGTVKALNPGVAAIVVTTKDQEEQALFYVNVTEPQEITVADFIAAEGKTGYLVGKVSDIKNTTYGNFNLTDETGTIYVYGCLTPEGVSKQFESLGVEDGDYIKVLASEYKLYGETQEAVNVVFVEKVAGPAPAATFEVTFADGIAHIVPSNPTAKYAVGAYNQAFADLLEENDIPGSTPEDVFAYLAEAMVLDEYVFTGEADFDLLDFMEYLGEEKLSGKYTIMVAEADMDEDDMLIRKGDITTKDVTVESATVDVEGVIITDADGNALEQYNEESLYKMTVGQTFAIKAKVLPADATNKNVSWEVRQDETTPAISFDNGAIKALNPGIAYIIVTTEDQEMKSTLMIEVKAAAGEADGSSFEKAIDIVEGLNSAKAVEAGYYNGAYFKYTAAETTVLSATSVNGSGINFYNEDQTQNYDATPSYDANYVATYSIKIAAGKTIYVMANQGYGDTSDEVSFKAAIATGVLEHGMAADDPIALQMNKTYWFEGGNAYFTYTATEDGVVVFSQDSYCYEANYTVDGNKTALSWTSETKQMNMPVKAGKTYTIWTSASSYSIFSVSAQFTQPKKGDTLEDPFNMVLGDNTLPKAAQKYYYSFINNGDAGFVTITAEDGIMLAARSAGSSWNNLADHQQGKMRLALDMDQEVMIIVERTVEAEADGIINAEYKAPAAGDTEGLAIAITSSETDAVSTAAGYEKYYVIKNTLGATAQLNVEVLTEGISSYGSSSVKVSLKGNSYGSTIGTGDLFKQEVEAGSEYIIFVKNATDEPIEFRAWIKEIEAGDSYNNPIIAVLGQNTVAAEGQKFYSYTPTQDCKLSIKVGNTANTTLFFPSYAGDEYMGIDGVTSKDGEYTVAATAGKAIIFRMTGAAAGEKFNIAEKSYGPGETRALAIETDGNIELDDLAPYKTWYVYNVTEDGVAQIVPENFETVTYNDNVYYALNDGNEYSNSLRGYNSSYDYEMQTKNVAVKAGDKLYIHLDVQSFNEGATVTISVKAPEQGTIDMTATDGNKFYATFSCDRDVIIAVGEAEVKTASVADGALSLDGFSSSWYYNTNGVQIEGAYFVPANTGVVIVSDKETVNYTYAATPDNYASIYYNTNMLRASSVAMEGDYTFYKLAYKDYSAKTGLGFYWGAENGAAFAPKANGAYLAIPVAAAESRTQGFVLPGGADGINTVKSMAQQGAIYNLQGQRVQQMQKGINIVNGIKILK